MRTVIKEQFSEIERKQAAYFLIENANRMAQITEPTLKAARSIEDGEQVTSSVLAGLARETYGLGYSEAIAVLFPQFDDVDAQIGTDRHGVDGRSTP